MSAREARRPCLAMAMAMAMAPLFLGPAAAQPAGDQGAAVDDAMLAGALADYGRQTKDPLITAAAARIADRVQSSDAGDPDIYSSSALSRAARDLAGGDRPLGDMVEHILPQGRRGMFGGGASQASIWISPHRSSAQLIHCRGGQPMKVSARATDANPEAQDLRIEISSRQGEPTRYSGPDTESQTVSWTPDRDGDYVVTIENLSDRRLLVQYAATRH